MMVMVLSDFQNSEFLRKKKPTSSENIEDLSDRFNGRIIAWQNSKIFFGAV